MNFSGMRRFLAKKQAKDQIVSFDVRSITPEIYKKVLILLREKENSFDTDRAAHASAAIAPLCVWVKAVVRYYDVARQVQPLQDELARLTQAKENSEQKLERARQQLAQYDAAVEELKTNYAAKLSEAESLKINLKKATEVRNFLLL